MSPVSSDGSSILLCSDRSPRQSISQSLPPTYSAKSCKMALYLVTFRMRESSSAMKWDGCTLTIRRHHPFRILTSSVFSLPSYTRSNPPSMLPWLSPLMHYRFVEYYLHVYQPMPFPLDKFPSLTALCEAVLRRFSRKNLLLSLNARQIPSTSLRPPEAQFQDEWYRAFYSLVGHGVGISSEWSHAGDGRIDFRIIEPAWGVELLRDGDRLTQHCDRFRDNGIYHKWILGGLIRDWLILDCRHTHPKKYSMISANLALCLQKLTIGIRHTRYQALASGLQGRLHLGIHSELQQFVDRA